MASPDPTDNVSYRLLVANAEREYFARQEEPCTRCGHPERNHVIRTCLACNMAGLHCTRGD